MNVFDENRLATEVAEEARENARLRICRALDAARKCRANNDNVPTDQDRANASELGRDAWQARKDAKEAEQRAASARRIACFKALPKPVIPEIDRPLKPPPRKPIV